MISFHAKVANKNGKIKLRCKVNTLEHYQESVQFVQDARRNIWRKPENLRIDLYKYKNTKEVTSTNGKKQLEIMLSAYAGGCHLRGSSTIKKTNRCFAAGDFCRYENNVTFLNLKSEQQEMRLLAFTDIHANLDTVKILADKAKSFHCELLVCAGDISWFGDGSKEMLAALNKIGLPIMLIHGNHEDDEDIAKLVKQYKNIRWIHKDTHEYKGYIFMGFGGGGFSSTEPDFVKFTKKHKDKKNIVLVTHQPPYNTGTDELWNGEKVGNKDFRKFIEEAQPVLAICGHIHDSHGKQDMINDSFVINPGPLGRVIELDDKVEKGQNEKKK